MSFTLLSAIILLVMAITVFRRARKGYKVGAVGASVRLALVIFSSVFSTFIADWLSGVFEGGITSMIRNLEVFRLAEAEFGDLYYPISVISEGLSAAAVYVPTFFLLYALLLLIVKIIFMKYVPKLSANYAKDDAPYYERHTNKLGAMIGVVSGLIVTVTVISPVAGILRSAEGLADAAEKFFSTDSGVDTVDEEFFKYSDDFMLTVMYSAGGKSLFDMTAIIKGSKSRASINEEIEYLRNADPDMLDDILLELGESDINGFNKVVKRAEESVILESILFAAVKNASYAWYRGDDYMGASNPFGDYNRVLTSLTNDILLVCGNSYSGNIKTNIKTFIGIAKILAEIDSRVSNATYEELIEMFYDGDVAERLRRELEKNPEMSFLADRLDRIVVSAVAEEIIESTDYSSYKKSELYNNIAQAINFTDYLSGEYRIDKVAEYVGSAFDTFGMNIPDGVEREIAERLVSELYYYGNIGEWYVENFFNTYYNY